MNVRCDYCGQSARLVRGRAIYPHRADLHRLKFWYCDNGHDAAYVGCHRQHKKFSPRGDTPLGRLADKELRAAKNQAHRYFDPLWKDLGAFLNRDHAYTWLAGCLGIPKAEAHIGMFDAATCQRVVDMCRDKQVTALNKEFD